MAFVALSQTNFATAQEPEIPEPCSSINHSPGQRSDCVVLLGLKDQLEGTMNSTGLRMFHLTTGVAKLYLNNRGLTEVPPELGNLRHMIRLELRHNRLGGIPAELSNLARLKHLDLSFNELGQIPVELGGISSLETLYLHKGQLSGKIPPELGNLSNLSYLDLSDNLYVIPIPRQLGKLSNLETMDLSGNLLNGEIPSRLGRLSSLQVLNLSHSIPIPEERRMKNLSSLTGCIPDGLEDVPENYNWLLELPYCGNAPPVIGGPDPVFISVENNTVSGAEIGTAFIASDDVGDSITWSLEGMDAGLFAISADGQISTAAVVNKEESATYTFAVKADDGIGGGTDSIDVAINVTDVDESPVCHVDFGTPAMPWEASGTGYAECAVAPYSVSRQVIHFKAEVSGEITITNTTPEGEADLRLKDSDGEKFYANLTGRIAVGQSASATVEAGKWYALMLLGSADRQTITGTVAAPAVNQAPAFAEGATATRAVAENAAAGTDTGAAVSASDPDGDTLTYSLGGTDAASFAIAATTGQLQTKASLDHESRASYSVTVTAADPSGATASIGVTISVTDVDEPPGKPAAPTVTASSSTSLDVSWTRQPTPARPLTATACSTGRACPVPGLTPATPERLPVPPSRA